MKYTYRTLTGVLALILVLGSVGCGKSQDAGEQDGVTSTELTLATSGEPALMTSADPALSTELDTAVEESPGKIWLVPSEAECPAADREDTPLIMTVEDVSPTQATLVLRAKDGSKFGVGYEPSFGIQRFEEEGWVGVGPSYGFPEPYYIVSARQEHLDTVKLEADGAPLEPGYYRLRKVFRTTLNGESVDVTYYAYFEITG